MFYHHLRKYGTKEKENLLTLCEGLTTNFYTNQGIHMQKPQKNHNITDQLNKMEVAIFSQKTNFYLPPTPLEYAKTTRT